MELKEFNEIKLFFPNVTYKKFIRECGQHLYNYNYGKDFIHTFQYILEIYLKRLVSNAWKLVFHCGRITLKDVDLQLALEFIN